jgi:CheY-like chemotaxis protein|nr:response regulator [uncultured Rhodoferax sp.]
MSTTQPMAASGSLRILVAEDNLINQRLVLAMLTSLGHTGVVVGDGEKALKCLSKLKFDVVLMDVMMPVLDGLGALGAIREQEQTTGAHMPVIIATAHTDPGDIQKFKSIGADGYVAKPIEIEQLKAELKRVLSR